MFKRYRSDRSYLIAEIGGNFIDFDQARRLVDAAAECGVDAVKLQTYRAEAVASRTAMFDMENTGVAPQFELFQKYQIGEKLHGEIFNYAESKGLDWFSTPSHADDVDLLERYGVGVHKIGSDDLTNLPFLRYVAETSKPIILSTGMSTLDEVREAVDVIYAAGNKRIIVLHAITSYPTHAADVNLRAMLTLMQAFPGLDVGYSDHTLTPVAALCAVAMGARVIERHFTLDKNADGPDHRLSSDPAEMKWLVDAVRAFETMLGSGIKAPAKSESITRINNRKSLVLARTVPAGHRLLPDDLAVKRPGSGIAPKHFEEAVGRTVVRDMEVDAVLHWQDLE
jgi:N-acetylneuraminate synthase